MFHPHGLRSLINPRNIAMAELTYVSDSATFLRSNLTEQYFRYYFPSLAPRRFLGTTIYFDNLRTDGLSSVRLALVSPHILLDKLCMYQAELGLAVSECMDHVVARLDATGDALCFLMHYTSLPAAQAPLVLPKTPAHRTVIRPLRCTRRPRLSRRSHEA